MSRIILLLLLFFISFDIKYKIYSDKIKFVNITFPINTPPVSVKHKVIFHPKVILITLDGVRWQDLEIGTDSKLTNQLSIPSNKNFPILTSGNYISNIQVKNNIHFSLPGYAELTQGKVTQCYSNTCYLRPNKTITDLFDSSAVFTSWDSIHRTIFDFKVIVNAGRNYRSDSWVNLNLLDNKLFVSKFGYDPLYRDDYFTIQAALDYYSAHLPSLLWVALGDTDEYAHQENYFKYLKSLQFADQTIDRLLSLVNLQQTIILVTTDHGRGKDFSRHGRDPESARIWAIWYCQNETLKQVINRYKISYLSDLFGLLSLISQQELE